ncbi:hypothetical protein AB0K74_18645, partial [Streptomyces sp. NPDC056159]|uniref:hypothetical protein n=1 Tax=Streptomyces sp. NPDC056159 TaxID=3155537 RepID=UPI0034201FEF
MAQGCPDTAPPTSKGPVTDHGLLVLRADSAFYASADGYRAAAVPQVGMPAPSSSYVTNGMGLVSERNG